MTVDQFCESIEKFYCKAMNSAQSEPVKAYLQRYSPERRKELYDLAISTSEFMPKFAKMRELMEIVTMDAPQSQIKIGCPKCNFTGFVAGPTYQRRIVGRLPDEPSAELSDCKSCDGTGWIDSEDILGMIVSRCNECNRKGLAHRQRAMTEQNYTTVKVCDCR